MAGSCDDLQYLSVCHHRGIFAEDDMMGFEVQFSSHAVSRYQERVKPALTNEAAKRELEQMAMSIMVTTEPPKWVRPEEDSQYVQLTDDVVFACKPAGNGGFVYALTCLVSWDLSRPHKARKRFVPKRMRSEANAARYAYTDPMPQPVVG